MKADVEFPRAGEENRTVDFDRTPAIGEWIWHESDWWEVVRVLWHPDPAVEADDGVVRSRLTRVLTRRVYPGH